MNKIISDISNNNSKLSVIFEMAFKELTSIGNNFQIRHFENGKEEIKDIRIYDYLLDRCMALIVLAIQYLEIQ